MRVSTTAEVRRATPQRRLPLKTQADEVQEARAWFAAQIRRAKVMGVFAEVVSITPARASVILEGNLHNRPINKTGLEYFERILREGKFRTLSRGIAIAVDGSLNDGQHKLTAVVNTGISADMMIGWGEDADDFLAHDQGGAGARTAGQAASMGKDGLTNGVVCASAARVVMLWGKDNKTKLGNDEIVRFIHENRQLSASAPVATRVSSACKCSPTPILVAHYMITLATRHQDKIAEFFDLVCTGAVSVEKHPASTLRRGLMTRDIGKSIVSQHYKAVRVVAAIVLAWNAFVRKKTITNLNMRPNQPFPEIV